MNNIWIFLNRLLAAIFAVIGFILFSGCGFTERVVTQTVYQDVFIPVPCDVTEPAEVEPQENAVQAVLALKHKLEEYKAAFRACKGGEDK